MRFGEKLSFLRKQHGITQMELAEKLDISRQAVSRWERGTADPSTENLVSIGKLFDVSVETLMDEKTQLQVGSAVQVTAIEEDTAGDKGRFSVAKIVGIVVFSIVMLLIFFVGMRDGQKELPGQKLIDIEDLEKEIINIDNLDTDDLRWELVE